MGRGSTKSKGVKSTGKVSSISVSGVGSAVSEIKRLLKEVPKRKNESNADYNKRLQSINTRIGQIQKAYGEKSVQMTLDATNRLNNLKAERELTRKEMQKLLEKKNSGKVFTEDDAFELNRLKSDFAGLNSRIKDSQMTVTESKYDELKTLINDAIGTGNRNGIVTSAINLNEKTIKVNEMNSKQKAQRDMDLAKSMRHNLNIKHREVSDDISKRISVVDNNVRIIKAQIKDGTIPKDHGESLLAINKEYKARLEFIQSNITKMDMVQEGPEGEINYVRIFPEGTANIIKYIGELKGNLKVREDGKLQRTIMRSTNKLDKTTDEYFSGILKRAEDEFNSTINYVNNPKERNAVLTTGKPLRDIETVYSTYIQKERDLPKGQRTPALTADINIRKIRDTLAEQVNKGEMTEDRARQELDKLLAGNGLTYKLIEYPFTPAATEANKTYYASGVENFANALKVPYVVADISLSEQGKLRGNRSKDPSPIGSQIRSEKIYQAWKGNQKETLRTSKVGENAYGELGDRYASVAREFIAKGDYSSKAVKELKERLLKEANTLNFEDGTPITEVVASPDWSKTGGFDNDKITIGMTPSHKALIEKTLTSIEKGSSKQKIIDSINKIQADVHKYAETEYKTAEHYSNMADGMIEPSGVPKYQDVTRKPTLREEPDGIKRLYKGEDTRGGQETLKDLNNLKNESKVQSIRRELQDVIDEINNRDIPGTIKQKREGAVTSMEHMASMKAKYEQIAKTTKDKDTKRMATEYAEHYRNALETKRFELSEIERLSEKFAAYPTKSTGKEESLQTVYNDVREREQKELGRITEQYKEKLTTDAIKEFEGNVNNSFENAIPFMKSTARLLMAEGLKKGEFGETKPSFRIKIANEDGSLKTVKFDATQFGDFKFDANMPNRNALIYTEEQMLKHLEDKMKDKNLSKYETAVLRAQYENSKKSLMELQGLDYQKILREITYGGVREPLNKGQLDKFVRDLSLPETNMDYVDVMQKRANSTQMAALKNLTPTERAYLYSVEDIGNTRRAQAELLRVKDDLSNKYGIDFTKEPTTKEMAKIEKDITKKKDEYIQTLRKIEQNNNKRDELGNIKGLKGEELKTYQKLVSESVNLHNNKEVQEIELQHLTQNRTIKEDLKQEEARLTEKMAELTDSQALILGDLNAKIKEAQKINDKRKDEGKDITAAGLLKMLQTDDFSTLYDVFKEKISSNVSPIGTEYLKDSLKNSVQYKEVVMDEPFKANDMSNFQRWQGEYPKWDRLGEFVPEGFDAPGTRSPKSTRIIREEVPGSFVRPTDGFIPGYAPGDMAGKRSTIVSPQMKAQGMKEFKKLQQNENNYTKSLVENTNKRLNKAKNDTERVKILNEYEFNTQYILNKEYLTKYDPVLYGKEPLKISVVPQEYTASDILNNSNIRQGILTVKRLLSGDLKFNKETANDIIGNLHIMNNSMKNSGIVETFKPVADKLENLVKNNKEYNTKHTEYKTGIQHEIDILKGTVDYKKYEQVIKQKIQTIRKEEQKDKEAFFKKLAKDEAKIEKIATKRAQERKDNVQIYKAEVLSGKTTADYHTWLAEKDIQPRRYIDESPEIKNTYNNMELSAKVKTLVDTNNIDLKTGAIITPGKDTKVSTIEKAEYIKTEIPENMMMLVRRGATQTEFTDKYSDWVHGISAGSKGKKGEEAGMSWDFTSDSPIKSENRDFGAAAETKDLPFVGIRKLGGPKYMDLTRFSDAEFESFAKQYSKDKDIQKNVITLLKRARKTREPKVKTPTVKEIVYNNKEQGAIIPTKDTNTISTHPYDAKSTDDFMDFRTLGAYKGGNYKKQKNVDEAIAKYDVLNALDENGIYNGQQTARVSDKTGRGNDLSRAILEEREYIAYNEITKAYSKYGRNSPEAKKIVRQVLETLPNKSMEIEVPKAGRTFKKENPVDRIDDINFLNVLQESIKRTFGNPSERNDNFNRNKELFIKAKEHGKEGTALAYALITGDTLPENVAPRSRIPEKDIDREALVKDLLSTNNYKTVKEFMESIGRAVKKPEVHVAKIFHNLKEEETAARQHPLKTVFKRVKDKLGKTDISKEEFIRETGMTAEDYNFAKQEDTVRDWTGYNKDPLGTIQRNYSYNQLKKRAENILGKATQAEDWKSSSRKADGKVMSGEDVHVVMAYIDAANKRNESIEAYHDLWDKYEMSKKAIKLTGKGATNMPNYLSTALNVPENSPYDVVNITKATAKKHGQTTEGFIKQYMFKPEQEALKKAVKQYGADSKEADKIRTYINTTEKNMLDKGEGYTYGGFVQMALSNYRKEGGKVATYLETAKSIGMTEKAALELYDRTEPFVTMTVRAMDAPFDVNNRAKNVGTPYGQAPQVMQFSGEDSYARKQLPKAPNKMPSRMSNKGDKQLMKVIQQKMYHEPDPAMTGEIPKIPKSVRTLKELMTKGGQKLVTDEAILNSIAVVPEFKITAKSKEGQRLEWLYKLTGDVDYVSAAAKADADKYFDGEKSLTNTAQTAIISGDKLLQKATRDTWTTPDYKAVSSNIKKVVDYTTVPKEVRDAKVKANEMTLKLNQKTGKIEEPKYPTRKPKAYDGPTTHIEQLAATFAAEPQLLNPFRQAVFTGTKANLPKNWTNLDMEGTIKRTGSKAGLPKLGGKNADEMTAPAFNIIAQKLKDDSFDKNGLHKVTGETKKVMEAAQQNIRDVVESIIGRKVKNQKELKALLSDAYSEGSTRTKTELVKSKTEKTVQGEILNKTEEGKVEPTMKKKESKPLPEDKTGYSKVVDHLRAIEKGEIMRTTESVKTKDLKTEIVKVPLKGSEKGLNAVKSWLTENLRLREEQATFIENRRKPMTLIIMDPNESLSTQKITKANEQSTTKERGTKVMFTQDPVNQDSVLMVVGGSYIASTSKMGVGKKNIAIAKGFNPMDINQLPTFVRGGEGRIPHPTKVGKYTLDMGTKYQIYEIKTPKLKEAREYLDVNGNKVDINDLRKFGKEVSPGGLTFLDDGNKSIRTDNRGKEYNKGKRSEPLSDLEILSGKKAKTVTSMETRHLVSRIMGYDTFGDAVTMAMIQRGEESKRPGLTDWTRNEVWKGYNKQILGTPRLSENVNTKIFKEEISKAAKSLDNGKSYQSLRLGKTFKSYDDFQTYVLSQIRNGNWSAVGLSKSEARILMEASGYMFDF